jgi:hypothetical protein
MNIHIFNVCMLAGWLMVLAGGVMLHPAWGLAAAGLLLLILAFLAAHIGGLYAKTANGEAD